MAEKHAISFFIPAYNCEKTLEESVQSIIEGNFSEGDELVLVNDGSTEEPKLSLIPWLSVIP